MVQLLVLIVKEFFEGLGLVKLRISFKMNILSNLGDKRPELWTVAESCPAVGVIQVTVAEFIQLFVRTNFQSGMNGVSILGSWVGSGVSGVG